MDNNHESAPGKILYRKGNIYISAGKSITNSSFHVENYGKNVPNKKDRTKKGSTTKGLNRNNRKRVRSKSGLAKKGSATKGLGKSGLSKIDQLNNELLKMDLFKKYLEK